MKSQSKKVMNLELLILFFLGISHIYFSPILNVFISMVLLLMFIFAGLENNIIMLFTALPFFNLFTTKIGTTSLFYLYIIVFIAKYFFKHKTINKNKLLIFLLFLALRLSSTDYVALAKWAVLISVLFITYKEDLLNQQLPIIIKYFTISFILSSFIGYYMLQNNLSIYTKSYIYLSENNVVTRFAGLVGDSVFYAQFASILISANLVLNYFIKESRINRYVQVTIMTIFVILTYSKTGIILVFLSLFSYFILMVFKNGKSKKTILLLAFLLTFGILGILFGIDFILKHSDNLIISNYLIRFNSSDLWTGRNAITEHYLQLLSNRWSTLFVAMPLGEYLAPFTTNGVNILNKCHNIYIETVCTFGLIATLCIFVWLFMKIIRLLKKKYCRIGLIPIILLLTSGFSLHGHFEFHYYAMVAVALAFMDEKTLKFLKKINSSGEKGDTSEKKKFKEKLYI